MRIRVIAPFFQSRVAAHSQAQSLAGTKAPQTAPGRQGEESAPRAMILRGKDSPRAFMTEVPCKTIQWHLTRLPVDCRAFTCTGCVNSGEAQIFSGAVLERRVKPQTLFPFQFASRRPSSEQRE